jgi:hypothetical protein
LRKVYDKLGVADRLELALYCLHHRVLDGSKAAAPAEPPAAAAAAAGANSAAPSVPAIPPSNDPIS